MKRQEDFSPVTLDNSDSRYPFMGNQVLRLFGQLAFQETKVDVLGVITADLSTDEIETTGLDIHGTHKLAIAVSMINSWLLQQYDFFRNVSLSSVVPPNFKGQNSVAEINRPDSDLPNPERKVMYALKMSFKRNRH